MNGVTAHRLLAVLIVCVLPFVDMPVMAQLKRFTSTVARLRTYWIVMAMLWAALVLVVVSCGVVPLLHAAMPAAWMNGYHAWRVVGMVLPSAFFLANLSTGLQAALRPRVREKLVKAYRLMYFLLPVGNVERAWWVVVSATAGICEEMLYRGFLPLFLAGTISGGPHLSLWTAVALSSVAFGFGHLYQGWQGLLQTTVLGLLFGWLAVATGSVVPGIVIHFLIDLQVVWAYRPQLTDPVLAAALMAGCDPKAMPRYAQPGNAG